MPRSVRELSLRSRLWLLMAAGVAVRIALAIHASGKAGDSATFPVALGLWQAHGFDFYGFADPGGGNGVVQGLWPYPPLFLGWLSIADVVRDTTGITYHAAIQAAPIAADVGLAFVVQAYLGLKGASDRRRLGAAALISLCPTVAVVSGYTSQIDSVAILPAAAALLVWEEAGPQRRALYAGALIGVGASVKAPALLVLLALVPAAGSPRELLRLVLAGLAVPVLLLAPFLVANAGGVANAAGYSSYPGVGGLSFLVQPHLSDIWLAGHIPALGDLNSAARFVFDHGNAILAVAVLGVFSLLARRRPAPAEAATILWLAFYVFAPNIFFGYLVWGIPFFLMAGHLRATLALEALVFCPTMLIFALGTQTLHISTAPGSRGAALYVVCMVGLSVACAAALPASVRRVRGAPA